MFLFIIRHLETKRNRSQVLDRNIQLFSELITTQLRDFHMVSPQVVFTLLIFLTMQSYKFYVTDHKLWVTFGQNNDVIAAQSNLRKRLTNNRSPNMHLVSVAKMGPSGRLTRRMRELYLARSP